MPVGSGPITIGGPIDNTSFYVVDRHGQPQPIGVPGELLIGGDGVADGYHNRPDLTQEKFIPDQFASERSSGEQPAPAGRLYRTGDLARHRPDGEVELLGRIDLQVKLRGFRIEIGEIEAVLARHALLQASAVVLREEQAGMAQLVGCYVERDGHEHSPAQLRALLTPYLPDYMIPTGWVRLAGMPTTANGKLDRKALATMAGQPPVAAVRPIARAGRPPRTASETLLAGIWAAVLNRAEVGVDDDLFDLGADSIHIFQITARANRDGLKLAAKDLLRLRTIARICSDCLGESEADAAAAPVYVKPQLSQFARTGPQGVPGVRPV